MNRVFAKAISFFGLALLFSTALATQVSAQDQIGRVLRTMDAYNARLSSLQADIKMVKTDVVLGVSDTKIGDTSYVPENKTKNQVRYIRINWKQPVQENIVVKGDEYKLYSPKRNLAYEGRTNQAQNSAKASSALALVTMSKAQLKADFDVVYVGEEFLSDPKKTQTWHLQLTPKVASSYKSADLWINKDGLPQQVRIVEKNNDRTAILLTGVKANEIIKADVFSLKYAKGTKVEKP